MKLPEDAGVEVAPALAESLQNALDQSSGTWRVDASAMKAFDSSTIALLLQARRLAAKAGREVEIVGVPAQLMRLAQLYGIDDLLALSADPSAVDAVQAPAAARVAG